MTINRQKTVLIVDDTRENLLVLGELLQSIYKVRVAQSGERALRIAATDPIPDLILLDVMMPDMDGYDVMRQLRQSSATRDIPVIFVTAMNAEEDEEKGFALGAVDYITKPIRAPILLARVQTQLALKAAQDALRDQNTLLEKLVETRTEENELIKDISLSALAMLAEKRDNETGNHLNRTQAYIEALIGALRTHPHLGPLLPQGYATLICNAAPLHDIGKVGIPDHILQKPGKLTDDEFEVMKEHSRIGAEAITEAIERVLQKHPERQSARNEEARRRSLGFLEIARQIALHHHEKWNGSGYPAGLSGADIPLPARLMALADVFDALIRRRHYKDAMSIEEARQIIVDGRGRHFDPEIVDAYLANEAEFIAIVERFADE